jgi:hypothetical protein
MEKIMEKSKITIVYKTEHGLAFNTYTEALVADRLYKGFTYIEEYKLRDMTRIICENFIVKEKKENETI